MAGGLKAHGGLMPKSRPARFPLNGAWPGVMRDDMVAAYFDFDDVATFHKAMLRGEVPRPSDTRFRGGKAREPIWALEACRMFIVRRHGLDLKDDGVNLAALV